MLNQSLISTGFTNLSCAETGKLKYNWTDQGSFCFTPTFMRRAYLDLETSHRYHVTQGVIFTDSGPVKVGISLRICFPLISQSLLVRPCWLQMILYPRIIACCETFKPRNAVVSGPELKIFQISWCAYNGLLEDAQP